MGNGDASHRMRWQWWAATVVLWPVLWVAAEYAFGFRAALRLNHGSRPGDPDPYTLGFRFHESLLAAC